MPTTEAVSFPQPAIVLVEPQIGENIGATARAMANFGLMDLRIVNPREGWPNPKAKASASGAPTFARIRVFPSLREAVAGLRFIFAATARPREVEKPVRGPVEAARMLRQFAVEGGTAGVLFGRERNGLTNDEITLADELLTMPVDPGFPSLNVAQAVLIVAYEWRRAGFDAERAALPFPGKDEPPAAKQELYALFDHLEAALDKTGFFRPPEKKPMMVQTLRAMLQRAQFTEPEVRTLRGAVAALERRPTRPYRRADGTITTERSGGLAVAAEIRAALPDAELIYVADDAAFPYGGWEEGALRDHVVALMDRLIAEHRPATVVIACHTASTLVLPPLRARHAVPFVGTVPAIKPAAERTRSGLISVLATPGTIRRDYTRGLIESFAKDVTVTLVGSPRLAEIAETFMQGGAVAEAEIKAEIEPAFVEANGRRTDMVVLACTHYPFLLPQFTRLAPWPVEWIDPAPAIAARVVTVAAGQRGGPNARGRAVLTSGREWSAALSSRLAALNLAAERSPAS